MTNLQLQLIPTAKPIKPPIKWVGGKRQFLPLIAEAFIKSKATTLIEPFCGGLSVTLGLRPKRAIINDLNPHLINFWRQCKENPRDFAALTSPMTKASEESFYKVRDNFNAAIASDKHYGRLYLAGVFYYLLKNCHGGVCRFNLKGEFNTSHGKYPSVNYDYDWKALADALKTVELNQGHWQDFFTANISSFDNAFVFADPPYHETFDYSSGFNWEEQKNLACYLSRLPCPVLATNSWDDDIVAMYKFNGFTVDKILRSGGHGKAFEMFATKNI